MADPKPLGVHRLQLDAARLSALYGRSVLIATITDGDEAILEAAHSKMDLDTLGEVVLALAEALHCGLADYAAQHPTDLTAAADVVRVGLAVEALTVSDDDAEDAGPAAQAAPVLQ